MSDEPNPILSRTAKAIHTLFYANERAAERYRQIEASLVGDDELEAFQRLSVGLINFDPLPPEALAGLRSKVAEMEKREAERPTAPSPRVRVEAGNNGPEAQYVKSLLEFMYTNWQGTLDYERGVHRVCFYSPFDDQHRRHTAFVNVVIDGEETDFNTRSYVLGPYLRVVDHRTKLESDDPWKVLHGDLTAILPSDDSNQHSEPPDA